MSKLLLPKGYESKLNLKETEIAIKKIKDHFERMLAEKLNLTRVSAPLFVFPETGLNDNLNGVERAVSFGIKDIQDQSAEIVHSLAKWKRLALYRYGFERGTGLYTDMNAIRRDEELDNIHSIYVDQWDWEKIISREERTLGNLKEIVRDIYEVFKKTGEYIGGEYSELKLDLPEEITFITSQELEDLYQGLSSKEREDAICKEKGAVFIIGIGGELKSGEAHDGRSPDYDDWTLNGDILFWNPVLGRAFELSSMGIRVDKESLLKQLEKRDCLDRSKFSFHKMILEDELPLTVGGGMGQSRICMYFLNKAHIGEVQAALWPQEMIETCTKHGIELL